MNAVRIAVEQLKPAPYNKRDPKSYGAKPLADLAASIKEKDILSPILVRLTDGHYQIIAGHRRYAAALLAGLKDVPCTVMDVSEAEGKEICAIENLQREDLGLMDEAMQILQMTVDSKLSFREIAQKIGKTANFVAREGRRFLAGVAVNAVVRTLTAVALLKRPAMMIQGKN